MRIRFRLPMGLASPLQIKRHAVDP